MTSISGRRTLRGEVRDAVVWASRGLIAESGIDALSVAEVARRLGVSTAAPYRHFADRAALLTTVLTEVAGDLADAIATTVEAAEDPADAFPLAIAVYARHVAATRVGFADLFGSATRSSPSTDLTNVTRPVMDGLRGALLARGSHNQTAASHLLDETLAAAGGLVDSYLAGALSPGTDVEAIAGRAADLARSLVPRSRRRSTPDRTSTNATAAATGDDQPRLF